MFDWNRTEIMQFRLEDQINSGQFKGRNLIFRDTPIEEGVYLGSTEREALVVDSKRYPLLLEPYVEAKSRADDGTGMYLEPIVLEMVYDVVTERLKTSDREVDKIMNENGVAEDNKISLHIYLERGYGVCRQQALLAAFMLERFKKERILAGKVSIDRNWQGYMGGHAWCRYTTRKGLVYILDVRRRYFGTLEEALTKADWDYRRENEQSKKQTFRQRLTQLLKF